IHVTTDDDAGVSSCARPPPPARSMPLVAGEASRCSRRGTSSASVAATSSTRTVRARRHHPDSRGGTVGARSSSADDLARRRAPSADDLARLRRDPHRRFSVRSGDGPLRPPDAVGMRNLVAHQIVADRDKVAAGAAQLSKLPKGASPSEGFKWEYVIHPWFRESVQDIGPPGGTRHWEEDGWLDASAVHHFKAVSGGALYLVTRDMQALIGHASAT